MNYQGALLRHYASRIHNRLLRRRGRLPNVSSVAETGDLLVLTAGFNGNLGDQAIASCVAVQCYQSGLNPVFVDYETVQRRGTLGSDMPTLMFGGELGDLSHFRLLQQQQPNATLSAIGGISIDNSFLLSPDSQVLDYLKSVKSFVVRDKSVAQAARTSLGMYSIEYAPDIVFSLASMLGKTKSSSFSAHPLSSKCVGINVQAFFHSMTRGGAFLPLKHNPLGSADDASRAETGYRQALRMLIKALPE